MQRPYATVLLLMAACGGDRVLLGPPTSRSCGNQEPIRISSEPGGFGGVRTLGDAFSVVGLVPRDEETSTFVSYLVDPCGEVPERKYADVWATPVDLGWFACIGGEVRWSTDVETPAAVMPMKTEGCAIAFDDVGLFAVDDETSALQLFATPTSEPQLVASEARAGSGASFLVDADTIWYVARNDDLFRVSRTTGARTFIADAVTRVDATADRGLIAWVRALSVPLPPYEETSVREIATERTFLLPGRLQSMEQPGFVFAGEWNIAAVLDVKRQRVRTFVGAGNPIVVRASERAAFVHVKWSWQDSFDDIVLLDMESGSSSTLIERVGWNVQAVSDPHGDGLLVFAGTPERPAWGQLVRITTAGAEVLADEISSVHRVGASGRIFYADDEDGDRFSIRIHEPDGTDLLFAVDANIVGASDQTQPDDPARVELDGDLLYNVHSGPERGLWRMPFDAPHEHD